ncbi:neuropeptides capa receptor-like [Aplysia californica]|uniref:Neuropeptides capa receptor-like n=1 Tax=Aplysia californica TaxID=6500 RepID=A0ABM0ZYU6_APLCA|nr:neuropeptides capa receptor-like [Aplysia californica]
MMNATFNNDVTGDYHSVQMTSWMQNISNFPVTEMQGHTGYRNDHEHNVLDPHARPDPISDSAREVFELINYVIICPCITLFGIVANVINMVVYAKMGLTDPVNITLFSLAISDLLSLITLVWHAICYNPLFRYSDIPFESVEVDFLTAGWPHLIFSRITSCLTAFITVERCLCVTIPLKVKLLLTARRTRILILGMYFVLITSSCPIYYTTRLDWKFYPSRNRTLLGHVFIENRETIERVSFALNNVFIPMASFATVAICTGILVHKLRVKSKWRESTTAPGVGSSKNTSLRDQRIVQMVIFLSAIFIVCFLPTTVAFLAAAAMQPVYKLDGTGVMHLNSFIVTLTFSFILESINSSVNIFVYLKMSSRYKQVFNQLFRKVGAEQGKCATITSQKTT